MLHGFLRFFCSSLRSSDKSHRTCWKIKPQRLAPTSTRPILMGLNYTGVKCVCGGVVIWLVKWWEKGKRWYVEGTEDWSLIESWRCSATKDVPAAAVAVQLFTVMWIRGDDNILTIISYKYTSICFSGWLCIDRTAGDVKHTKNRQLLQSVTLKTPFSYSKHISTDVT